MASLKTGLSGQSISRLHVNKWDGDDDKLKWLNTGLAVGTGKMKWLLKTGRRQPLQPQRDSTNLR